MDDSFNCRKDIDNSKNGKIEYTIINLLCRNKIKYQFTLKEQQLLLLKKIVMKCYTHNLYMSLNNSNNNTNKV